ncbi:MAG TPA: DNA-binding domain-containing protein, partial [Arenibaculum sp.]|nr:DNA-binding domain-containing protein [Arenibaculum sp.]
MSLADTQAAFAAALTDPSRPVPPGITTARGGPAAPRFAVYRNNVAVGLAAALAARFPVVARLVGEDFFRAMARAYVERHKPASPLLFEYGDEFPGFVAAFGPASVLPYLPDVARLEAAWSRAYHAADARPLDLGDLAAMAPDDLSAVRLAPHPSAAVVRSGHPVGAIWQAHRREPVEAVRDWRHESVLVV